MMGMSSLEWSRYMHERIGVRRFAGRDQRRGRRAACATATGSGSRCYPARSRRSSGSPTRWPLGLASLVEPPADRRSRSSGRDRGTLPRHRLLRGGRSRQARARRLPRSRAASRRRPGARPPRSRTRTTASCPHARPACASSPSRTRSFPPAAGGARRGGRRARVARRADAERRRASLTPRRPSFKTCDRSLRPLPCHGCGLSAALRDRGLRPRSGTRDRVMPRRGRTKVVAGLGRPVRPHGTGRPCLPPNSTRPSRTQPLWPPRPIAFERATSISASRGSFGT